MEKSPSCRIYPIVSLWGCKWEKYFWFCFYCFCINTFLSNVVTVASFHTPTTVISLISISSLTTRQPNQEISHQNPVTIHPLVRNGSESFQTEPSPKEGVSPSPQSQSLNHTLSYSLPKWDRFAPREEMRRAVWRELMEGFSNFQSAALPLAAQAAGLSSSCSCVSKRWVRKGMENYPRPVGAVDKISICVWKWWATPTLLPTALQRQ